MFIQGIILTGPTLNLLGVSLYKVTNSQTKFSSFNFYSFSIHCTFYGFTIPNEYTVRPIPESCFDKSLNALSLESCFCRSIIVEICFNTI